MRAFLHLNSLPMLEDRAIRSSCHWRTAPRGPLPVAWRQPALWNDVYEAGHRYALPAAPRRPDATPGAPESHAVPAQEVS